jgi:hypothetical protein
MLVVHSRLKNSQLVNDSYNDYIFLLVLTYCWSLSFSGSKAISCYRHMSRVNMKATDILYTNEDFSMFLSFYCKINKYLSISMHFPFNLTTNEAVNNAYFTCL